MSHSDRPPQTDEKNDSEETFQLSPVWMIVGVLAIALGVGCGLVMSSATFLR